MALAMTMDVAGYPVAPPLKRKWWGKGGRQKKPRYNDNIHEVVKVQSSGFVQGVVGEQSSRGLVPRGLGDLGKKQGRGLKTRKFYAKRRVYPTKTVPRAPYNDNSFLMRVRRSGGLEPRVSLTPTTSFMSSPKDSSYKLDTYEDFVDHEDYGYGSMTGLIRLRATEDGERSSGSSTVDNNTSDDDDMCVVHPSVPSADSAKQLEERLDVGVSRFEMTRPAPQEFAELRVARQDSHIQYLEDENLVLKDRLFLLQQEVHELRQRLQDGQTCIDVDESDESDH